MNTLNIDQTSNGVLIFSDPMTGALYHPCDENGIFIDLKPKDYQFVNFVSNGFDIFPINFFSENQLGWISQAISAVASIGSSLIGKSASKQANQSAEKQLRLQEQIESLKAQSAERQAALLNQQQSSLSTGTIIGLGVAGVATIGSVLYLIFSSSNEKKSIKKPLDGTEIKHKSKK